MSFTRFRKSEKSKGSSVQGSQDYQESVNQQDNLSQYSHHSNNQYDYKPNTVKYNRQKQQIQPQVNQKYNNDINNIQKSEHNSQNQSVTSSSSSPDQLICNNCINDALIYEKQLNNRTSDYPNGETPLDMQKRLDALEREKIKNKISARQGLALQVGKNLGKPTNKDKLIQENERGKFFLDDQQEDPQKKKVLEKYNQNDARNRGTKPFFDKPGVDDYYKNYVDNYKGEEEDDDYDKKREQDKYNKALLDQIEANKKLRNKDNIDNKKYKEEMKKQDEQFMKDEEERAKKIKAKENEMYNINLNLIEAKRKKAQDDKMIDDYDQKRKADNLRKLMEDEEERKRQKDDETRKTWQKELDRQILEKNQKNQLEKDRNKIPNYNKFTHEENECCQNGKC